jgi:GT2 family glycosyltransferase
MIASAERGTRPPDEYYIVDNGGKLDLAELMERMNRAVTVTVMSPPKNLGVAASWNRLLEIGGLHQAHVIIANDDVVIPETAVDRMVELAEKRDGEAVHIRVWDPPRYGLFLQTPEVARRVGLYDEKFYPAYWEDIDYERRMELAVIPRVHLGYERTDPGSRTLATASHELKTEINRGFENNKAYYRSKWGGPKGQEQFVVPFGGADE